MKGCEKMISVSVIVPCYNMENYIDQCMDSLINQTLKSIEIILVNDASQDSTIEILRRYEEQYENVIAIDSPVNLKQGGARNLGLDIARGKYIGFVDPDDWIDREMYEKLYHFAEENNYEIAKCYLCRIQKISDSVHTTMLGDDIAIIELTGHGDTAMYEKIVDARCSEFGVCDAIFNKSFLLEHRLRFPEHVFYEDAYFSFFTNYLTSKRGTLEEVLYYYFSRDDSTEGRRNDVSGYEDLLESKKLLLKDIRDRGLLDNDRDKIEEYFIFRYYISVQTAISRFDILPVKLLNKLSKFMLTNFPNYQQNKYYVEGSDLHKIILQLLKLNDLDPVCLRNTIQEDKELYSVIYLTLM